MNQKKKFLINFFQFLEDNNFDFCVPRGFKDIPENLTITNDLDIIIKNFIKSKILKYLKSLSFDCRIDKFEYLYGAKPHYHFINKELDLHLDIVDGLYFCSLNDFKTFIPLDDELQISFLSRKRKIDEIWLYQPSYEDELLHLICHCLFDKRKFKKKHIERILEIKDKIRIDIFRNMLNICFKKADKKIFKLVEKNEFENFYEKFVGLEDY